MPDTTFADVGDALGTSRQAAEQRFGHVRHGKKVAAVISRRDRVVSLPLLGSPWLDPRRDAVLSNARPLCGRSAIREHPLPAGVFGLPASTVRGTVDYAKDLKST
ncbi:hypothetical protein [Streptomyces sp. NPDC059816]|uniref:hypothetical protein n=1 Tax=Streptomyces sp. NPDC059816 TaxID=3346960 RepID=UPI00364F8ED8